MLIEAIMVGLVKEAVGAIINKGLPVNETTLAQQLPKTAAQNPVVQNQMNAEPIINSRTAVGSSTSFLAAAGYVLWATQTNGFNVGAYDWAAMGPSILILLASGYAFYGRVKGGLKPIKWFGWFRK